MALPPIPKDPKMKKFIPELMADWKGKLMGKFIMMDPKGN